MLEQLPSTRDALILAGVACGGYVVLVAAAQFLRRVHGLRFRWAFHFFALAAGILAGLVISDWRTEVGDAALRHLSAATLVLAAFPIATILNHLLWSRRVEAAQATRPPRLLSDATTLVLCAAMLAISVQYVYGQPVPGLLAGSGVAAIVLGLAMQDLLANTIAGIALFVERPFKTGDWLLIDGREARVVEVTWRSVRLLTDEDVFLDVPNSKVVQESIINFHQPNSTHAVKTTIGLHYDIPPARAMAVLHQAAACVPNTLANMPPRIELMALGNSAVDYEVEVMIDDHGNSRQVLSDLRTNLWYAARRAGMEIPYPQLTISRARPADNAVASRAAAADALRRHPIFTALGDEANEGLARISPVLLYAPSEHMIEQGAAGGSMFLVIHGEVEVRIARDGKTSVVARLRPGDCVGEMSLLTGDPRGATVVALTEVEAMEIGKDALSTHVRAHPEVLAQLSDLLARRQLANEKQLAQTEMTAQVKERSAGLLSRFRRFFDLAG